MSPTKIVVVGGGQMGLGIAFVSAAHAEVPTVLVDSSAAALDRAVAFHDKLYKNQVKRGTMTQAAVDKAKSRLTTSQSITEAVKGADFIIEAVPENLQLKSSIFAQLAKEAPKNAVLATNTSSLSITKIASVAKGAEDRVVGMHFFIPVPRMKGVEVIRGIQTSDDTHIKTVELAKQMKKIPSTVTDSPGFLANRLLTPYISEAIYALESGLASAEDIDNIMVNAMGMPIGPLRLADFIGLDTMQSVNGVIRNGTGEDRFRKSVLIQKLVDAGHLGMKTGKGIYDYRSKL